VLHGALVVLVVLHVFPLGGDSSGMLAGFVPWDLGYHLVWMAAAALVVLYMTGPCWPDEPPPTRQPPVAPEGEGEGKP